MAKIILFIFLLSFKAQARDFKPFQKKWEISDQKLEILQTLEPIMDVKVENTKETQSFKLSGMALHKKNCSFVLRKLSMLEEYPNWIDFIKSSKYHTPLKLWVIHADHTLLPYKMIVEIVTERPTKTGVYPFIFPSGMFTGLKGTYTIEEVNRQCFFHITSYWEGPKTKIPNFVIELFSKTLSELGAKLLIRKSLY